MSVKVLVSECSSCEILNVRDAGDTPLNTIRSIQPSLLSPTQSTSSTPASSGTVETTPSTPSTCAEQNLPQRGVYLLPSDTIVDVLCFLRSTDLCSCLEASKYVFSSDRVSKAIELSLPMYPFTNTSGRNSPNAANLNTSTNDSFKSRSIHIDAEYADVSYLKPQALYIREMKAIMTAVNAPVSSSGYYVSNSWLSNAKKYYETVRLPEMNPLVSKRSTPSKKQEKIRLRRGSDALPPWPCINADITCVHGTLALPTGPRAKRKILDKKNWKLLRKFYPEGCEYKVKDTVTCMECEREIHHKKLEEECKRENVLRARNIDTSSPLYSIFMRKNGIPSSHLRVAGDELAALHTNCALNCHLDQGDDRGNSSNDWSCAACTMLNSSKEDICHMCSTVRDTSYITIPVDVSTMPLIPGIYNLVPRYWLRSWRQYIKDPSIASFEPLDCTSLLCSAHGNLIVPPHVEEYIKGIRRTLLTNLGDYPGDLYEIVTSEEFDILRSIWEGPVASTTDFAVRFFNDEDGNIEWNIERCQKCDCFNYHYNQSSNEVKRRSSSDGHHSRRNRDRYNRSSSSSQSALEDYFVF